MTITDRERLMLRSLILMRQAGNASGTMSFIMRTPKIDVKKEEALKAQLKCDLGDLLLQTEMLIKDMGLNLDEVKDIAYTRWAECRDTFRMNGKSDYFI